MSNSVAYVKVQKNLDIISNKKISRVFYRIPNVINHYIKQQGTKDRSLTNTRKHFKMRRINVMYSNNKIITSSVTIQPNDISVSQPARTDLMLKKGIMNKVKGTAQIKLTSINLVL